MGKREIIRVGDRFKHTMMPAGLRVIAKRGSKFLCGGSDGIMWIEDLFEKSELLRFGRMNTGTLAHEAAFAASFNVLADQAFATAERKGFHEGEKPLPGLIALMHSELSEALEADRHGNPPDDKIPEFSGVEAEFADVIIRIMDTAKTYNLKVGDAVIAKMRFNEGRQFKHGGKKY